MSLADRVAKLELRLRPSAMVPIFMVELCGEDDEAGAPLLISHQGRDWQQEPGESSESFKERAMRAASAMHKAISPFPVLMLVATRPGDTNHGAV
jgi:hypothetical protein